MKSRYFIEGPDVRLVKTVPTFKQKREQVNQKEQDVDIRRALQVSASTFLQEKQHG